MLDHSTDQIPVTFIKLLWLGIYLTTPKPAADFIHCVQQLNNTALIGNWGQINTHIY